jgi:hypothetical protein
MLQTNPNDRATAEELKTLINQYKLKRNVFQTKKYIFCKF